MIEFNFNQSVGFPLETEVLDKMQQSWAIFNMFGAIVGNLSIISGCVSDGSTVSDGIVFINNKVLKFKGGAIQEKVIIVEAKEALEFEDGNAHDVITTTHATFGVATSFFLWTDFKRGFETKGIPAALEAKEDKETITALIERIEALEDRPESNVPIGLIAIWGRPVADIPDGWAPYEPLKGRIPIGLDTSQDEFDALLDSGGSKTHTNTVAEMAPHDHDIPTDGKNAAGSGSERTITSGSGGLMKTKSTGTGTPYSIMNPYRVVHFIEYVG